MLPSLLDIMDEVCEDMGFWRWVDLRDALGFRDCSLLEGTYDAPGSLASLLIQWSERDSPVPVEHVHFLYAVLARKLNQYTDPLEHPRFRLPPDPITMSLPRALSAVFSAPVVRGEAICRALETAWPRLWPAGDCDPRQECAKARRKDEYLSDERAGQHLSVVLNKYSEAFATWVFQTWAPTLFKRTDFQRVWVKNPAQCAEKWSLYEASSRSTRACFLVDALQLARPDEDVTM